MFISSLGTNCLGKVEPYILLLLIHLFLLLCISQDYPFVHLIHHFIISLTNTVNGYVILAQEEGADTLGCITLFESIHDPVPVVLQVIIFKKPNLHLQIVVVLHLLLNALLCFYNAHPTLSKMLLGQPLELGTFTASC